MAAYGEDFYVWCMIQIYKSTRRMVKIMCDVKFFSVKVSKAPGAAMHPLAPLASFHDSGLQIALQVLQAHTKSHRL